MYKHILIPTDGSPRSANAIAQGIGLAKKFLGTIRRAAEAAGVRCEVVHVTADPHEGIIDTAISRECDLIFMAAHAHRGVSALVLGSESLTRMRIPVLVCR